MTAFPRRTGTKETFDGNVADRGYHLVKMPTKKLQEVDLALREASFCTLKDGLEMRLTLSPSSSMSVNEEICQSFQQW